MLHLSPCKDLLVLVCVTPPAAGPEVRVLVYGRGGEGHHVSGVVTLVHLRVSGLVNVGPGGGLNLTINVMFIDPAKGY